MWETIRYRRLQALAVVVLAALVTACAVFTPLYDRATQQALTRIDLEHVSSAARGLQVFASTGFDPETGVVTQPPAPVQVATVVPPRLRTYFGAPILQTQAQAQPKLQQSTTSPNGLLVWRSGECGHLRFSVGRCPARPAEIAVSHADSDRYGARVGTSLVIPAGPGSNVSRPLTLQVVGIYRQVPGPYWDGFRLTDRAPSDPSRPDVPEHDVWLTGPDTFSSSSAFRNRRAEADFLIRVHRVGVDQIHDIRHRIDRLRRTIASSHELAQFRVASGLDPIADDVAHQRSQSRVTVPLLMVQLGLVAIVVLWLVLGAATEQRRPEIAVAMLRGRGRRGAQSLLVRELVPVALTGVPVGFLLAILLGWAARSMLLPGSAPFEIRLPVVIAVLGAALLLLVVTLVAVVTVARQPVERLLRRVPERHASWSFGVVEALLLAVAATAVVAFATGGLTGPIAWTAPTLLALAVGLLLAHATTPLAAALGHRLLRRRRVGRGVSALDAARNPATRRTIAIVTVATSLLVFVTCAVLVGARNRGLAADQTAGAPVTLEVGGDDLAAVRSAVHSADPNGRHLTTVLTVHPPSSEARETVAVEPSTFGRIALAPDQRLAADLRRLAVPRSTEIVLRGDALTVTVRTIDLLSRLADRPDGPAAPTHLELEVVDSENRTISVPVGRLPDGTTSRTLTRSISCLPGCHLVGITVVTRPTAVVSGAIDLVGATTTTSGAAATPVPLGAGGAWNGRHGAGGTMVPSSSNGADLSVVLRTTGLERTTMRQAWLPETVPVLVTHGDPRSVSGLDGEDRSAHVVGHVARIPQAGPNAALANLDLLARGTQPDGTDQAAVWLDREDPHVLQRLRSALQQRGLRVVGRTSLAQVRQRLDDSIAAWSLALGVVVGVAAVLLGVIVVVVLAVTTWRSRSRDLAALRLSGVTGTTTRRIATLAQVPAVVVAVLAGTACGVVGARLTLPTLPLFAHQPSVSTLDLRLPWVGVAVAVVLVLAVLVVTGWLTGVAIARRADLQRVRETL